MRATWGRRGHGRCGPARPAGHPGNSPGALRHQLAVRVHPLHRLGRLELRQLTREVPSTNRLLEALAATVSAKVMSQPGTLPDVRAQVFNHVPLHHGITGLGFACS